MSNKKFIGGLLCLAIIGVGGFLVSRNDYFGTKIAQIPVEEEIGFGQDNNGKVMLSMGATSSDLASSLVPSSVDNVFLTISFATDDIAIFEEKFQANETVLDLLKNATSQLKLSLETKDYGEMGVLVEKIGEKKGGDDGKYWMYYINGKSAQVSVSKYQLKAGDKVEFRFEKSEF